MRRLLGILLIVCLTIPFAALAEEPIINEGAPLEDQPLDVEEPKAEVTKEPTPEVTKEIPILADAKYVPYSKSIITTILELIGLEQKETVTEVTENSIDVFIGDFRVATIPEDSKFAGIDVHEKCLPFQYGTDNWFACEQELLK